MSSANTIVLHRHGRHVHGHSYARPHRHLLFLHRSRPVQVEHQHAHTPSRGHSHGLVDRSIVRSRGGIKAVSLSLAVLALAAGAQVAIFVVSGSIALLADLIHNFGDALTAVPLAIAFFL